MLQRSGWVSSARFPSACRVPRIIEKIPKISFRFSRAGLSTTERGFRSRIVWGCDALDDRSSAARNRRKLPYANQTLNGKEASQHAAPFHKMSKPEQEESETDDEQRQRRIKESVRRRIGEIHHRIRYRAEEGKGERLNRQPVSQQEED